VTPNDDEHFMLFTADNYIGPVENFFDRLKEMRSRETPVQQVKPYDKRKYIPYKGNIRQEDIMTQGTQGLLGERSEQLGSSDRGVIKFRKIVLDAINTVLNGGRPKGIVADADAVFRLDTQVGVRPVGTKNLSPLPQSERGHL